MILSSNVPEHFPHAQLPHSPEYVPEHPSNARLPQSAASSSFDVAADAEVRLEAAMQEGIEMFADAPPTPPLTPVDQHANDSNYIDGEELTAGEDLELFAEAPLTPPLTPAGQHASDLEDIDGEELTAEDLKEYYDEEELSFNITASDK